MSDENRPSQNIGIDWPGFASVSEVPPQRFEKVAESQESSDGPLPSVTDTPLAAVARWFNVSESEVQELIAETGPHAPAEPEVTQRLATPPAAKHRPSPVRPVPTVYSSSRTIGPRNPSHHSPMGFKDFRHVLRRRLLVVIVGFILGVAAGWSTAPGQATRETTFTATHTALYDSEGSQAYTIDQVALLASSGEVPSRVAARLKLDRGQVRSAVLAVANGDVGTLSITARSPEAAGAVSLAEITAEELANEIDAAPRAAYQAEVDRLTVHVETARNRLKASPKNTPAEAQAQTTLETAEEGLQQYKSSKAPKAQLRVLETATATAFTPAGVRAPNSKPVRALLLGGLGLLFGLAGAVALERLDSRIRSKAAAEEAFGAAVIAEVPLIPKSSQGQLLARTQPTSPFVEAYRGLRTHVALWTPEADSDDGHRVIVVTSPSAGEGKTTTVAHLAAMLAEIGRSVVVISADLRRPRLHEYFDLPLAPGLVEALGTKNGPPVFARLDQATPVRGVRLVPSGAPVENPAPLFEHAASLLATFRGLADFVLVDAPPLLVANDAVEMARYADGVLLVARAGQTPIEAAERSAETLERLEIPVVGTVLVASEAASTASRYYASHYYAEREKPGRLRRRAAASNGQSGVSTASQEAPPVVSAT